MCSWLLLPMNQPEATSQVGPTRYFASDGLPVHSAVSDHSATRR